MSKNTDRDTPAQRNHGKRVTADRRRQLGMGLTDSHQLSLDSVFTFVERSRVLTVWHLALHATILVNFTADAVK